MPGLLDSKPIRPLNPELRGNDLLAQTSVLALVNNPNITENLSDADKAEQVRGAAMLAEALGGPSPQAQEAQARANKSLGRKRVPVVPPVQELESRQLSEGLSTPVTTVVEPETSSFLPAPPVRDPFVVAPVMPITKIFFTGLSGSGKTFLATQVQAHIFELNSVLGELWVGPAPQAAEYLKLVAWANGQYDSTYPNSTERVAFVKTVRASGLTEFGSPNFLVKQLLTASSSITEGIIAVTDVQTVEEFKALSDVGFRHFHVAASQTTMAGRNRRQRDEKLATHLSGTASGKIQKFPTGDKIALVWSDPITERPSPRFYTVAEFKSEITGSSSTQSMPGITL